MKWILIKNKYKIIKWKIIIKLFPKYYKRILKEYGLD